VNQLRSSVRPVVEVDVDATDVELAADALWQALPSAVLETDLGGGRVRLTADVADLARLAERWGARVLEPDGDAYLDTWRAWATPQRAGRRLLVHPAWLGTAEAEPHEVVVRIDPGRAFGSGSHPTTQLVLAILDEHLSGGERVLDVGCGSGVLAVAACLLGATSAVAVDLDPVAVEVTRGNAEDNGVGASVHASTTPVADVPGAFDVVLANIGGQVLLELAPDLGARTAPGGLLVLAGMLEEQADDVRAAYAGCGEVERRTRERWTVLALRA
jgi:ribosomal protein L11 methyltransferase